MLASTNAGIAILIITFIVLVFAAMISLFGLWIWTLVDAIRRPEWAYRVCGSDKTLWIVLIAVLGWIASIIYLASVRGRVEAAELAAYAHAHPQPEAANDGASRFCTRCGGQVTLGASYCTRCGEPVRRR